MATVDRQIVLKEVLMTMPTWITITTAIISTGTTVFLAIITWRYVRLTREYVRLTNEILKATNKPEVIMYLRYEEGRISLRIENIGTGYASDVKFAGELLSHKSIPQISGEEGKPVKELPPFKNGIPYLGSGHKLDTVPIFSIYVDEQDHTPKQPISVKVSYKDSTGISEDKTFFFEPANWRDRSQFMSPHSDDIANELVRIAGILENISDKPRNNDFLN